MSIWAFVRAVLIGGVGAGAISPAFAWDYEGHRMVNQLALSALPKEFPAFVREPANVDRIIYLANLPDRWRNVDPWLQHSGPSWTDHFIDIEQLVDAGIDPKTVPSQRYSFALMFAAGRIAHAEKFRAIDPAKNAAHTYEWPGFSPWAITEWYQKLRSAFACLKAYEEVNGTPEEIANAKADIIYTMGVIGHYIADSAQPLHTTESHHGWFGPNPNGYTTAFAIHSWIDSGFIGKAAIKSADLAPRVKTVQALALPNPMDGRDPFFVVTMDYILASFAQVEPLYKLEKAGLLGMGDQPITPEGRAFIEGRLLRGTEMLAQVWLTAWKTAPVDTYLRTEILGKRAGGAGPVPKKSKP
ncbi:MAG TPA: hypothetical protein VL475_06900 [Planctomycetaceae bacterium]|nr:hypothetical protein [Planctomycetaceae bacterium]